MHTLFKYYSAIQHWLCFYFIIFPLLILGNNAAISILFTMYPLNSLFLEVRLPIQTIGTAVLINYPSKFFSHTATNTQRLQQCIQFPISLPPIHINWYYLFQKKKKDASHIIFISLSWIAFKEEHIFTFNFILSVLKWNIANKNIMKIY